MIKQPTGYTVSSVALWTTNMYFAAYTLHLIFFLLKNILKKAIICQYYGRQRVAASPTISIEIVLIPCNNSYSATGGLSLLWPQVTTFERSQRYYLQPGAIIVRFGQRLQQLKDHREAIGCHSSLCPAATTIEESQDQGMSAPCHCGTCSQRIIAPV